MPAGYMRVWLSMEAAIDHVIRVAQCGRQEARDALVLALIDGAVESRFGDHGQEIKPSDWQTARYFAPIRGPNGKMVKGGSLRPFFDPPPEPETLPERPSPVEVRREDVERLWAAPTTLQGTSGPPAVADALVDKDGKLLAPSRAGYRTGLPGKPTSWHLIEAEFRQRFEAGHSYPKVAEWARVLVAWLRAEHPSAPPVTEKTVSNRLSPLLRCLIANRPK